MPTLGDKVYGHDIGKKDRGHYYVWSACRVCHRPRWVKLLHGQPQNSICRVCQRQHKKPDCGIAHWWRIESPGGPVSHGRCKKCGAERDFPNDSYGHESPMNPAMYPVPRGQSQVERDINAVMESNIKYARQK